MSQRLSIVTLGVRDLDVARRFYVGGLGWEPMLDVAGEVVFIQVGHGVLLALWDVEQMAADMGAAVDGAGAVALAHNVGSDEDVVAFMEQARAAGATILKPAQRAFFGGFHGYFEDPCGFRWEIAHNPNLTIADDGTVSLGS